MFSACLPFSAYSETKTATSGNAAGNGQTVWDMQTILPPETGLIVNQVHYNYTVRKIREDDFTVTIQNERVGGGENIFESTDDWSGLDGNTIDKNLPVANLPREIWGDGSLTTTGEGTVTDANVRYSYIFDDCLDPLTNPLCPQDEPPELPVIVNPFDSDEVQNALADKADLDDEDDERKDDEENSLEDKEKRRQLAQENNPLLNNAAQLAALFDQMSLVPKFDSYYAADIQGGTYEETVELKDGTLPDNRRAMRSLAKDQKFETIIRSQYDK